MSKQLSNEEQEVRELIVAAGPRHAVPVEDAREIRAAARQEWRQMVARERRRRRALRRRGGLALAASVLAALAIGWWWSGRQPAAAPMVASVELAAGTARALPPEGGGEAVELLVGGELAAGVSVETGSRTAGLPAGAALRLGGGQSLRLAAGTRVRLISERRFELLRGTLYVDSDSAAGGGVEVVTALGMVTDIGTQFEVRVSEDETGLRVRVREGSCALAAGADRYVAERGEQLSLDDGGAVARARVEPHGPEWDWVVATAPSIEIEGLPLSSFLEWAGRELGRDLRYADPLLARAAGAEIVVHGSIQGLTPTQALDAVLASTGLAYAIDNGTLSISDPS